MASDFLSEARRSRRSSGSSQVRSALLIAIAAFLVGVCGMGWFAYQNGMELPLIGSQPTAEPSAAIPLVSSSPSATPSPEQSEAVSAASAVEQANDAAEKVEQVVQQTGGMDQRIAGLEQRLTNLDLQTQAATGNAARAEGLLIAFAARRRIERGDPLGYLEDQLRLRFGAAQPKAVETVIEMSNDPLTIDQLLARLEGLTPELAQGPSEEGAFTWFAREIGELFVVRRESAPSPQPGRRLQRARLFLESGRAEAAAAEVRNLPGAEGAQDWIADAERYAAAQRALDLLESTAVLEPRELRDGGGNQVAQPSPAGSQ